MLKITADRDARRLVLEGSLAGSWVDILDGCWRQALATDVPHPIAVDLSDVTYIDARGKALLAIIHQAGGTLVARGAMNVALIQEIVGADATSPRPRGAAACLWLFALLIPAIAAAVSCTSARATESTAADGGIGRPPVAVSVAPVDSGSVRDTVDVVGSLSPKFVADVKSEVSGTVTAVYVTEWVPVRAGARLARLDATENAAAVDAVKAGESQARVAETRARREYDRALALKQYGLITAQAVDDARSALEAAEATTASARAQVRAAEARLAKSFITAPIGGTIALRGVNVGDRVENMGSGAPMFRIVDNRLLDLTVSVPSVQLGAVRVGQPLEFTVDAIPGRTFTGKVLFINPAVEEASRAARVVAEVRNTDDVLKGGLFARGRIVVSSEARVLQVPRAALLNWNVGASTADVFVVREGKAEKRTVTIRHDGGSMVAIQAGLASGELVVTTGGFTLKPGDRVTVTRQGV